MYVTSDLQKFFAMVIGIKAWTDFRIVDQINLSNKMSQLPSFFNDIVEVLNKVMYVTRVLAAISHLKKLNHSFLTRGLPVFSRDLYAF
jgi:hypothetical protein